MTNSPQSPSDPASSDPASSDPSAPLAVLLGEGYTAGFIRAELERAGWRVVGTSRAGRAGTLRLGPGGVDPALRPLVERAALLIASAPPELDGSDPVLAHIRGWDVSGAALYLSATSVYGDREGRWAFEAEAPTPLSVRGRRRAAAELAWMETGWPVLCLRLAGIYGPGRSTFAKLRAGTARAVEKPGHVVNRIHAGDAARLVRTIAETPLRDPVWGRVPAALNVADGHPADPAEVVRFAARLAGFAEPPTVDWRDPALGRVARSFYAETKRVDIARARLWFGWRPRFADFRAGLRDVWAREREGKWEELGL